jgi:uncharacterized membrane protein YcgQ (UPF0703/DUF1980 family)
MSEIRNLRTLVLGVAIFNRNQIPHKISPNLNNYSNTKMTVLLFCNAKLEIRNLRTRVLGVAICNRNQIPHKISPNLNSYSHTKMTVLLFCNAKPEIRNLRTRVFRFSIEKKLIFFMEYD